MGQHCYVSSAPSPTCMPVVHALSDILSQSGNVYHLPILSQVIMTNQDDFNFLLVIGTLYFEGYSWSQVR